MEARPMLKDFPISARIAAVDAARAKAWYEEKLGLVPEREEMGGQGYWYQTGGTWFYLYQTAFAGTAKNTVAGWQVPDLRGLMGQLRARGVVFNDYDYGGDFRTVDGVLEIGGYKAAWFTDSEGNVIELSEVPEG
jgi:catechol 2,3-dioxygenase-like lactoylglutathione lyase family enzyme